jgi:hypothetical protein
MIDVTTHDDIYFLF